MNNHEAAEMIRNDMKLHHDYLSGKYRKALNMAISALQAQDVPDTKQPETGYWISARDEDGWHMWLICSECRAKETNLKAKYCPVCGRKMA